MQYKMTEVTRENLDNFARVCARVEDGETNFAVQDWLNQHEIPTILGRTPAESREVLRQDILTMVQNHRASRGRDPLQPD